MNGEWEVTGERAPAAGDTVAIRKRGGQRRGFDSLIAQQSPARCNGHHAISN